MGFTNLALAGIAEAAIAISMLFMGSGLAIIILLTFLALRNSSRSIAKGAMFLLVLYSVVFQPWDAFLTSNLDSSDDPEALEAAASFALFGICWFATCVIATIASIVACRDSDRAIAMEMNNNL